MSKQSDNRFERIRDLMGTIMDNQSKYMDRFFGVGERPYGTVAVTGQKLADWWQAQEPRAKLEWWMTAGEDERAEVKKVTGMGGQGASGMAGQEPGDEWGR